ncbi:MAG: hypothetical protein ABIB55_01065 [Candidatus Nealsonbacteria bacterium]
MAVVVTGEQYYDLDGQLSEIKRQLRQPNGYPFSPQELKFHLQAAIEGRFSGMPTFSRDMRKEGWTLVEDVGDLLISIAYLEIVSVLKETEDSISEDEIRSRIKKLGTNLGQHHAEYLLEHSADIPVEWREYFLVFAGTIWRNYRGDLEMPCLCFDRGRWRLYFDWLKNYRLQHGRLVRSCK